MSGWFDVIFDGARASNATQNQHRRQVQMVVWVFLTPKPPRSDLGTRPSIFLDHKTALRKLDDAPSGRRCQVSYSPDWFECFSRLERKEGKRSIDTLVANQLIAQRSWSCVVRLDLQFVLSLVVTVDSHRSS